MTNPLTRCGACYLPFTDNDRPKLSKSTTLVFTVCNHIFHELCLTRWVLTSENHCPLCRATIYQHQAGKNIKAYWSIFITALSTDPEIVRTTLKKSEHKNDICAVECREDLPIIPLRYDAQNDQLFHGTCSTSPSLLVMQDLVQIVKQIVQKDPELKKRFTPTPPTFFQRMSIDHPFVSNSILIFGALSLGAFVLRRI
jgi:hypothetical protein